MKNNSYHKPVMPIEVEKYLINSCSGLYVDCTLGGGGHSSYFLEKYPEIKIIGLDCDENAIKENSAKHELQNNRLIIYRENFGNLRKLLEMENIGKVDGLMIDLGVSSHQLDNLDRGFSFKSSVLDMRLDNRIKENALDLVNRLSEKELATIIFTLGEERFANKIARTIVTERERKVISTGAELAAIVEKAKKRFGKVHPATKVFQALRMAVNRELENLEAVLADLPFILKEGGRAVILSYHSLEDRAVKLSFRANSKDNNCRILTKKVVFPSREEMKINPRCRSAKLRAMEKL